MSIPSLLRLERHASLSSMRSNMTGVSNGCILGGLGTALCGSHLSLASLLESLTVMQSFFKFPQAIPDGVVHSILGT